MTCMHWERASEDKSNDFETSLSPLHQNRTIPAEKAELNLGHGSARPSLPERWVSAQIVLLQLRWRHVKNSQLCTNMNTRIEAKLSCDVLLRFVEASFQQNRKFCLPQYPSWAFGT